MGKARQLADAVNALSTGGLTFSGTGARIYGDFSNNTVLSRTLFQTTAINGITNVGVIPNGTATSARLSVFGSSDPTNASSLNILQVSNGRLTQHDHSRYPAGQRPAFFSRAER